MRPHDFLRGGVDGVYHAQACAEKYLPVFFDKHGRYMLVTKTAVHFPGGVLFFAAGGKGDNGIVHGFAIHPFAVGRDADRFTHAGCLAAPKDAAIGDIEGRNTAVGSYYIHHTVMGNRNAGGRGKVADGRTIVP